jgi:hypothetical protein
MLGRMAAETGREITWEEHLQHGKKYSLGIDLTKFT